MSILSNWLQQPQSVWLRRAVFQVHLWTGIGLAVYILVISVTGSILVFRSELLMQFTADTIYVQPQGERLDDDAIREAALVAFPDYRVVQSFEGRELNQAVEVWLENDGDRKQRLFDPFTGEDLGNSVPPGIHFMSWTLDLHDNLLYGRTGRTINGVAGILFTALVLTGFIIWWPGLRSWPRSLYVQVRTNWKRFNWSLHSAVGFWSILILLIWGVSGIYLVFPNPFSAAADWIEPLNTETFDLRTVDTLLAWLARLHFGRFAGMPVKVLYAVIGLVPPLLFVTGGIMWWNRVLRKSGAASGVTPK
jgi:uncharacterized iron-regulated membrane protein